MNKNISAEIEEAFEQGRQVGLKEAARLHPPLCRAPQNIERIPVTWFQPGGSISNATEPEIYCTLPFGHAGPHRCETRSPLGGFEMTCSHMWGEQTLLCQRCGKRVYDEYPNEPILIHNKCGGEFKRLTESDARDLRLEEVERDRREYKERREKD